MEGFTQNLLLLITWDHSSPFHRRWVLMARVIKKIKGKRQTKRALRQATTPGKQFQDPLKLANTAPRPTSTKDA